MNHDNSASRPYWETKSLQEMNQREWEGLCDGCARCCLNKLEDWDTGKIMWTNVACSLLDDKTCRCKDYENRFQKVPDCVQLTARLVAELSWLPPTCAYRLLDEGKPLYAWHPLISGDPNSVIEAGISVLGRTIPENDMPPEQYENHIVKWPGRGLGKKNRKKSKE